MQVESVLGKPAEIKSQWIIYVGVSDIPWKCYIEAQYSCQVQYYIQAS